MKPRIDYGVVKRWGTKRWLAALIATLALVACDASSLSPTPTLFLTPTWPPPDNSSTGAIVTPAFPIVSTPIAKTPVIGVTFSAPIDPLWPKTVSEINCTLEAEYVTDVTVPDYTEIQPGASFTKTWRMKNTSTCDWRDGFVWTYLAGGMTSDPGWVYVPSTKQGETADIPVSMMAPMIPGTYTGMWQMQAPDGRQFGSKTFVIIRVPGVAAAPQQPQVVAGPGPSLPADRPVISGVTSNSRKIFLAGQTLGNRRDVFSKVGDSITHTGAFLMEIGNGVAVWHNYGSLQPAAGYFSNTQARAGCNSFNNSSLASFGGWSASDPLNPAKADPACNGSAPLDCEYQIVKPSVVIIMLGSNDSTGHTPLDSYQASINRIVEISIEKGVIPVLTTIPWNAYNGVDEYNSVIITAARTYDVPLIDYWAAMEKAPGHGVSGDGVHPTAPPDGNSSNFSAENLQYGTTIRNLVTLQMLDALWRQVLAY